MTVSSPRFWTRALCSVRRRVRCVYLLLCLRAHVRTHLRCLSSRGRKLWGRHLLTRSLRRKHRAADKIGGKRGGIRQEFSYNPERTRSLACVLVRRDEAVIKPGRANMWRKSLIVRWRYGRFICAGSAVTRKDLAMMAATLCNVKEIRLSPESCYRTM